MKHHIFIKQATTSKWWHALQRGESTAEKIASFFANNEPREAWRNLFRSYAVILKRLRHQFMSTDLDQYIVLHDAIARTMLLDVHRHYTDSVFYIVTKYFMFYKYDVEEIVASIKEEDAYEEENEAEL